VETGAGLKLFAEWNMSHRTSFCTSEFFNNSRTSVIDVKISALQLSPLWACLYSDIFKKNQESLQTEKLVVVVKFPAINFFQF
jgi:hypothetical protein